MVHQLKIKEEYFEAIRLQNKNFEVRKNDRNFKAGDYLALNEVGDDGVETGCSMLVKVTYILDSPDYCKEGYVIMSIKYLQFFQAGREETKEDDPC